MKSCTQAKVETVFVRFLAAAVFGAVAWFAAEPAAQYFNYELPLSLHAGITAVLSLGVWFVTKNLVDFTADCLDVPQGLAAPAFDSQKPLKNAATGGKKSAASEPSPARRELKPDKGPYVLNGKNVSFTVTSNPDGTLSVVAVVRGLTNSQFKGNNGLRKRLENIREIAWTNPVRQPDGSRRMEGTVSTGAGHDQLIARLKGFTDR